MGDSTVIAWTDHTWNPWRGCHKISPGCANCYMFRQQENAGWNPNEVVRTTTWADPKRWQRQAAERGEQRRVFTCSWSDWFIPEADAWRPDAWALIKACPNLHFQILTKRPRRIAKCLPPDWGQGYPNVWLGVSVESERYLWRVEALVNAAPARTLFISAEPLLEPLPNLDLSGIDWLIVGGESGPNYRPMDPQWARDLRDKAAKAGTAFFFKQSAAPRTEMGIELDGRIERVYPRFQLPEPSTLF